ncbi:neurofilament heavy polypeptide isoform X2 [Xiphias gladius]|uniref:neurofilament heavy polypeptide isoform X2 n=1 Tax=Xiphias gladius TaxID=8245 RepID=UPI001A99B03C|nr:neurofilament heavy polypeptide isoform X2 [Xiphias gladius]
MALRKQLIKDASDMPCESRQIDRNTQEDEAVDDRDDKDELSSSLLSPSTARQKRKREKDNRAKPKEMTEEEMMDLALRLSEQEASDTALRLQREEEAMMKAIQESMVGQTRPCPPSQSQSLLADAEAPFRLCSRRKLLYSNGKKASAVDRGASEDVCTPQTDLNREAKGTGDENNNRNKKRKRKEGSPLLEMPDLSQTQKIYSQASPCSSESLVVALDSPQSSDSTQIDDCQLPKSPVFPRTGCRAKVDVPRLSQDLLETCRTSGFVLCSQDSGTSTQKSQPARPKSPTFPRSPKSSSNLAACPKSPVFSEADQGDDGETELSPEYLKSPVFGRNTQPERSPSACNPPVSVCNPSRKNSGFVFSTQESSTSSVRSTSHRPKSPVFPRSPGLPKNLGPPERSMVCKSPVSSETDQGQTEQSHGCSTSRAFGGTGRGQKVQSAVPSAAERGNSNGDVKPPAIRDPSRSPRRDSRTDGSNQEGGFNKTPVSSKSDDARELSEASKDWNSAETELTSDMTLLWSDEGEDVTPVGSPSPVFPEERPVHQADGRAASLNHVTAASPGTTGSNCRLRDSCTFKERNGPSSSTPTSTFRQQLSTTEQELRPISSQGAVSRAGPAGGPTVHYYWGVPFCPRGLDPDTYTQVILAQMEVYDKSLKQAQRCLLRKAPWGEAILPQPEKPPSPESPAESPQHHVPRRGGLRKRGKKLCEASDTPQAEAEEEEEDKNDGEEEEGRERESKKEQEKNGGGEDEDGQVDIDDCQVCPETQLSNDDSTQDLTMVTDAAAEFGFQSDCRKSPDLPDVEMIPSNGAPAGAELQGEEEEEEEMEVEVDVDAPVDGKMEGNIAVSSGAVGRQDMKKEEVTEDRGDPDVEEITDRGLQRSASPEVESAAIPRSPETNVDCPICQRSFPVTKIEVHAAYCDGEVAVVDERRPEVDCFQLSLKPRRKRTRRAEETAEETNYASNTGKNQEKCYICEKAVPLRDYSRHTELCIRRWSSKTEAKVNLVSALEQTENRNSEAGPSGSKLQPGEVIDLRDDDDEEEDGVSALSISNSPIRSFTPISEATGCLIDFKKQQRAKKPSHRRR